MPRRKLESQIERDVADWWETHMVKHPHGGQTPMPHIKLVIWGRAGWPDHWFFAPNGRFKMIEFKRFGEEPNPLQHWVHAMLRSLGFDVEVFWSKEAAIASLERMLQAPDRNS